MFLKSKLRALLVPLCLLLPSCVVHTYSPQQSDLDRTRLQKLSKGQFKVYKNREYSKRGEAALEADVYVPAGDGPFPAVLLIHGGSWSSGSKALTKSTAVLLARNGFTAVNINYSLLPNSTYPAQIEDCANAVRWMQTNFSIYKIDPEKIGVWGYSAGAHLAALLATSQDYKMLSIKALVAGGGPYNLLLYPHDKTVNKFLGTTVEHDPAVFKTASPLFNVSARTPATFLYHGSWDDIVDPKHTLQMKEELDKAGVINELYWVRGAGHISLFVLGTFADKTAVRFLKRHLN